MNSEFPTAEKKTKSSIARHEFHGARLQSYSPKCEPQLYSAAICTPTSESFRIIEWSADTTAACAHYYTRPPDPKEWKRTVTLRRTTTRRELSMLTKLKKANTPPRYYRSLTTASTRYDEDKRSETMNELSGELEHSGSPESGQEFWQQRAWLWPEKKTPQIVRFHHWRFTIRRLHIWELYQICSTLIA